VVLVLCLLLAGGGAVEQKESFSSKNFEMVAKLEEDYIPCWQPVAYNCRVHRKLHAYEVLDPILVSHDAAGFDGMLSADDEKVRQQDQTNNRVGQAMEIPNIRVDRHHSLLSSFAQLVHHGDDEQGNNDAGPMTTITTGFTNFSPIHEESNTWFDSFVIDTHVTNGEVSSLRGRNPKSVASWSCERSRDSITERPEGAPLVAKADDPTSSRSGLATSRKNTLRANETAIYEVYFRSFWNKDTHPYEFPENATFSEQIMVAHNTDYRLFRPGHQVTKGFELFAEQGDSSRLEEELSAEMPVGVSSFEVGLTGRNLGIIVLDIDHDLVSTATRLSPSPDWFTGLSNVRPVEDDHWIREFTVDVYPLDAGTEEGDVYLPALDSSNMVVHDEVTRMTAASVSQDNPVFLTTDAEGNPKMLPIGQYEFVLTSTAAPTMSPAPSSSEDTDTPTTEPTSELQYDHPYLSQMSTKSSVYYEVSFESSWSSYRHPFDYPPLDATFGRHTIVSHSDGYKMWQPNKMASQGMQSMAIDGRTSKLMEEIDDGGSSVGGVLNEAPVRSFIGYLQVDRNHKKISTACHIAPSPDWFTGVVEVEPHAKGYWLTEFSIGVAPYDAGVVDGKTYTDRGDITTPQRPISAMTVKSIDPDSPVFISETSNGEKVILPLGRYIFRLFGTAAPTSTPYPTATPTISSMPTTTSQPTNVPTPSPTSDPTDELLVFPSAFPTPLPIAVPSVAPSTSLGPTETKPPSLSARPTGTPSMMPIPTFSQEPSMTPSEIDSPSNMPSMSSASTSSPTGAPTIRDSTAPSRSPMPSLIISSNPSHSPSLVDAPSTTGSTLSPTTPGATRSPSVITTAAPTYPGSPEAPSTTTTLSPTNPGSTRSPSSVTLSPTATRSTRAPSDNTLLPTSPGATPSPTATAQSPTTSSTLSPTTPGATRSPDEVTPAPVTKDERSEAPSAPLDFNLADADFTNTDDIFSAFQEGDDDAPADRPSTPSPTSVNAGGLDGSNSESEPTNSLDEGLNVTQAEDPPSFESQQDDYFSPHDDDAYYSSSLPTANPGLRVSVATIGILFWIM
jgi:hypothetical protein